MPQPRKLSIGQTLDILRQEFPDISISKIRYLESEGLVSPERAQPSGYRRYSHEDIERLTYILQMQRDHYLPLKVIHEHLEIIDSGGQPPQVDKVTPTVETNPMPSAPLQANRSNAKPMRLSRRQLLQVSGLSEATMIELERQNMVVARRGTNYYGREALTMCVVARKLQAYGLDTRHLRAIKQSADREAGIIEQASRPVLMKSKNPAEELQEISKLVVHAHAAMIYSLLQN